MGALKFKISWVFFPELYLNAFLSDKKYCQTVGGFWFIKSFIGFHPTLRISTGVLSPFLPTKLSI